MQIRMHNRAFLGRLACCVMSLGSIATAGSATAPSTEPLYVAPIPDDMNVGFTENHIVIDRSAQQVFDFVTTPANTARWFPRMHAWTVAHGGAADKPQKLGDVTIEEIEPVHPGDTPVKVQYTVVALIPGHEWVAVGQDLQSDGRPSERIRSIADWSVKPLPGGRSLFVRIFESVRPNVHNPDARPSALDTAWMQPGLVGLKQMIEKELPKK